ncbi:MAG TPA: CHAT domain-containing protein [Thermoanaerobaculia bacterium]|jgi:CHAT domain-containing protein|nr:CHAT domain-containing protein [Thermoanaerobaculia bacterium]
MIGALAVSFLLAVSSPAAAAPAPPAVNLADCESRFPLQPEVEGSAKCFYDLSKDPGQKAEATGRLRALLARHPGHPWLSLYLGHLDTEHSEELYRAAARAFASRREARGEVLARANLQRILFGQGRMKEAGDQASLALEVAEASGDPELIARGRVVLARHLWTVGEDLERAYFLLRRAESALFPNGPFPAQRDCLIGLGNLSLDFGRYQEGLNAFRRLADLAAASHDLFAEANARYGMARAVLDSTAEMPGQQGRQEAARLARQALDTAVAAGHLGIQSKAHFMLGILTQGREARQHFDACLAAADSVRDRSYCLNGLARHLASSNPREAQRTIDESLSLARQAEDYWSMAFAWRERMRVSWAAGGGERAAEDSRSALNAIEALRDLQAATSGQAEAFSTWSEDYYWLSGRLIEETLTAGRPGDLERAFGVAERMRARSLIGTLEAAHALPAAAAPLRQRRGAVLERISGVQRQLMNPDLPAAARAAAGRDLERLETEEAEMRNQLARMAPALDAPHRPDFATLERVRQALGPGEALLSFQIAPWKDERGGFGGGSWLLAVSRAETRIYRLPGRGELRNAARLWGGLFDQRNGGEAAPAASLYRQLLEQPLRDLPPGIRRLILVPDDALHQLPFAALRATPQSLPLAARFELTQVPSATLWLSWKRRRPGAAPIPALALADPPLPGGGEGLRPISAKQPEREPARERAAVFASGVRLGPLPYAREESRSVVRDLGGGSVRRLGDDASEAFLKSNPLQKYGILHFATHAVTDETNPDRSGVLLAPGDANQDGLLQIREIVDLDLNGRVVVLSACSSNTGALLRGEGVMSLARAFFQAGAHTVVASLWRLRDDEAADFFDRFYGHLGRGASISGALQAAQRDLIAEGAPAAAWAGIVVLGDGDLVPLPGGRKGFAVPWWWGIAGVTGIAGIAGIAAWIRRRA